LPFREKKTKQKNKLERYLRFKRYCNFEGVAQIIQKVHSVIFGDMNTISEDEKQRNEMK